MAEIQELDHLLQLAPSQGVKVYDDEQAMAERITEWLECPAGTVADYPSWGHNLSAFQHEPEGSDLAPIMEMAIAEKMPVDIPDLVISGISVNFTGIDLCQVIILHQIGVYAQSVSI
jgi:hypothetical protein